MMLCIARTMPLQDVCLSIWMSHAGIVETVTPIIKHFPPSVSYTNLVFLYQTACQYSHGDPPNVGVQCKKV